MRLYSVQFIRSQEQHVIELVGNRVIIVTDQIGARQFELVALAHELWATLSARHRARDLDLSVYLLLITTE